jgi:ubiquinone/menaquinone biosynthesis C-methylase UbiE
VTLCAALILTALDCSRTLVWSDEMNFVHRWLCKSDSWRAALQNELVPWALRDVDLGENLLEIGPGPGLSTDLLRERFDHVTSIEIDPKMAGALRKRMRGANVDVIEGDATRMPFADGSFSGAVSFTMLHHIPKPELQDALLREARRVLKPGAQFAGIDSRTSLRMKLIHIGDTLNAVDPDTFGARLERAGFRDVFVESNPRRFRFHARA